MSEARTFYVLMRIESPDTLGPVGEHPDDPVGFLPVFQTHSAALVHAGDRYAVHPVRLVPPKARPDPDRC